MSKCHLCLSIYQQLLCLSYFCKDISSSTEASLGLLPFLLAISPNLPWFPFPTCNLCLPVKVSDTCPFSWKIYRHLMKQHLSSNYEMKRLKTFWTVEYCSGSISSSLAMLLEIWAKKNSFSEENNHTVRTGECLCPLQTDLKVLWLRVHHKVGCFFEPL